MEKLFDLGDASPAPISVLAKQMTSADRKLREKAALAMMDMGPPALPSLIEIAQNKDPLIRRKAIYVITVIGQPSDAAVNALIRALDDEDETVRFWACVSLGRVKDQRMRLAPLLTARQTDSSEKVRCAARNAFQQLTLSNTDR
jgi:HEAT repeat protein